MGLTTVENESEWWSWLPGGTPCHLFRSANHIRTSLDFLRSFVGGKLSDARGLGSRPVLGGRGGEIPPRYSTLAAYESRMRRVSRERQSKPKARRA